MWSVAFDESAMSRTQVQLWHNRSKERRKDVNDEPILLAQARQQPMKTLVILIIFESLLERLLIILAYRWVHGKQFLQKF